MMASVDSGAPVTEYSGCSHSGCPPVRSITPRVQFKNASALGARRTVVLGPDEVAEGVAVVKDMASGDESRVPLAELGRP